MGPVRRKRLFYISIGLFAGLIGLFAVWPAAAFAQDDAPPSTRFDSIDNTDQLASTRVQALHQDTDGVMWFGTFGGLSRFDAREIVNYIRDPDDPDTLPDNVVVSLESDSNGLWVGTASRGLVRLDPSTGTFEPIVDDATPLSGSSTIFALDRGRDALWAGASDGLAKVELSTGAIERFDDLTMEVSSVLEASDGTVWVGTREGLFALDPAANRVRRIPAGQSGGLSSEVVTALAEGEDGDIWVGTETEGLNRVRRDGTVDLFDRFPGEEFNYYVLAVEVDRSGMVWTTSGSRLYSIDPDTGDSVRYRHDPFDPRSIKPGAITDLLVDRDGDIWLAKQDSGVQRLDRGAAIGSWYRVPFDDPNATLVNNVMTVTAVTVDGATQVLGTTREDPVALDLSSGTVARVPALVGCRHFAPLRDSRVWCFADGLSIIDVATGTVTGIIGRLPEEIGSTISAIADGDGGTWVATSAGVVRIDEKGTVVDTYSADDLGLEYGASTLALDGDRLIAGRWDRGVAVVDLSSRRVRTVYANPEESDPWLSDPSVLDVATDEAGFVYVATNGGLDVLSPDLDSVRRLTPARTAVPTATVTSIDVVDEGTVWVTTPVGVSSIDTRTGDIQRFGPSDGVQPDGFGPDAIAQLPDGRLVAGGPQGFTVVDPRGLDRSGCGAQPELTELAVRGVEREPSSSVSVPAGVGTIEMGVRQLCYSRREAAQLRYRFVGDDRWVELPPGSASLTLTVPSADAVIEIQGADRVGGWLAPPLRVTVDVVPPWYQQGWVQALAIGLLVGAVIMIAWLRNRSIRSTNERLEADVAERTAELSVALNEQRDLVSVVAHDIRAPVLRQMLHLGMLEHRPVVADADLLRRDVEMVDGLVQRLVAASGAYGSVHTDVHPVSLDEAIRAAVAGIEAVAELKGIDVVYVASASDTPAGEVARLVVQADNLALDEIIENAVDNSIKYSHPGQTVTIETIVDSGRQMAGFRVVDNGVGIDPDDLGRLFSRFGRAANRPTGNELSVGLGLFATRRLATAMQGSVDIHSDGVGRGTVFTCWLPLAGTADVVGAAAAGRP